MTLPVTDQFSVNSAKWWSMAAQILGWRADDFWQSTPTEVRGALAAPNDMECAQGPSIERITEMLEREKNGR